MRIRLMFASLGLVAMFACNGEETPSQDLGPRVDIIVPQDPGGSDPEPADDGAPRDSTPSDPGGSIDLGPNDPGTQDPGSVDTSPSDPGTEDPGTVDTSPNDPGTEDPGTVDTSPNDPGTEDPGSADLPPVDPGSQDLPVTPDLPPADAEPFQCAGPCDPLIHSLVCLPDGLTICYCNSDNQTWEPYACADVCTANGMVGTACVLDPEGQTTCDCSFDCTRADLVAVQCDQLYYTPCTCGSADPCGWIGDGFCDADCVRAFPEDHFLDTADCACSGACDPEDFNEFCDLDSNPCKCSPEGVQTSTNCDVYCGDQGAVVRTDERCTTFFGMAFCNCQDWSCEDPGKVANQCDAFVYTPCTCAAADPCGWVGDGYCDAESCNALYPEQPNLDDRAQDC